MGGTKETIHASRSDRRPAFYNRGCYQPPDLPGNRAIRGCMSDITLYGSVTQDEVTQKFVPTIVFGTSALVGNKSFVSEPDALSEAQKQVENIKIISLQFLIAGGYQRT